MALIKELDNWFENYQEELGVHISHIVQALEDNPSEQEVYGIWLGNSMETPTPINTKKELFDALGVV